MQWTHHSRLKNRPRWNVPVRGHRDQRRLCGRTRVCYNGPMTQVWLKTNRRALLLGMLFPAIVCLLAWAAFAWCLATGKHWGLQLALLTVAVVASWMIGVMVYAMTRPRVGYEAGNLLVFLEPTKPTPVPINIVEVFFLGQGPSELPRLNGREPETQNVIIRLAESAADWKHRDVRPAIGHWCEGYITIRGSWCEPITPDVMRSLNRRLVEVKAAARNDQA
jgi:hypothetical protein